MLTYAQIEQIEARPSYDWTPKQFHEIVVRRTMGEYECSRKEAEEQPGATGSDEEHFSRCLTYLSSGGRLRRQVLDALDPSRRRRVLHDYPGRHAGYILPEVRQRARSSSAVA